jgi:hypothetical protein
LFQKPRRKKMKKFLKNVAPYALILAFMGSLIIFTGADMAAASTTVPVIPGGKGGQITDINSILTTWITNIRVIGAVAIVIAIVIAAVIIGLSMGNSQKRALGISALISAIIGIILVLKAPDIANYVINQSNAAK